MAKTFRAVLTQTIEVTFDDDVATEKSAAHVVERVARCYFKEGLPKNMKGRYFVRGEEDATASNVRIVVDKGISGR